MDTKNNLNFIKNIKRICMGFIYSILIVIIIISLFLLLEENNILLDIKLYTIISESMEPTLKINDIIITKKVNSELLKDKDIITFNRNEEVITHRIVQVVKSKDDNLIFVTKGDNNKIEDNMTVESKNVIGKVIFSIPKLGKITVILKNKKILAITILVLLTLIMNKIRMKKRKLLRKKDREEYEKNKIIGRNK